MGEIYKRLSILWDTVLDFITLMQGWWIVVLNRNSWVSVQADKIILKSQRQRRGWESFRERWYDWMHPQKGSASFIIALMIVSLPQLILATGGYRLLLPLSSLFSEAQVIEEFLKILWQVFASLIGITFVIIVFLTQYAQEREYERRAFPLFVSRTWMVFTVMMGFLTLLSMGVNLLLFGLPGIAPDFTRSISLYNLILFALNIVLTIRLYLRTYQFLSPSYFRQQFQEYVRQKVITSVHSELRSRISERVVLEHCKQCGIGFSHIDDYPNMIAIRLSGVSERIVEVTDINLGLLSLVGRQLKRQGVSKEEKKVILVRNLLDRLSAHRSHIAFVSPALSRLWVSRLLQKVIRVSPISVRGRYDVTDEILLNRDLLSSAVREGRAEDLENLWNIYFNTLESFLLAFDAVGIRYTLEMVEKESASFRDWPFVNTILRQYADLLDIALQSYDAEIVHLFVGFPFRIMSLAFQRRDHLLFRRFSNLYSTIYQKASSVSLEQKFRQYILDRCWRLLGEFDHYYIGREIENRNTSIMELPFLAGYSIQILLVFNQLIKAAFDLQDMAQYRVYTAAMRSVPHSIERNVDEDDLRLYKLRLEMLTDPHAREQLGEEYARVQAIFAQKRKVKETRGVLMMGMGAWVSHQLEAQKISIQEFRDFIQVIDMEFVTLVDLYTTYIHAIEENHTRELSDWSFWELSEKPESHGEISFSSMQFADWIARYYLYRLFALVSQTVEAQPELPPDPASKGVLDTVERQITFIEQNNIWRVLANADDVDVYTRKAATIRSIHSLATKKQKVIEEANLTQQPLDQGKIVEFSQEVHKAWQDNGIMRGLMGYFGRYEPHPNAPVPEGLLSFGVNELTLKGAFVRESGEYYIDWGASYGRALASGEDGVLSEELMSLPIREVSFNDLDSTLCQALLELYSQDLKPILVISHNILYDVLGKLPHFQHQWSSQRGDTGIMGVRGYFMDAVVIELPELQKDVIILVDMSLFGTLAQYRPTEDDQFPLSITVQLIDTEQANEIVEKNPNWRKDEETGEELDLEAAIRRVQQHVILQISEKCRLEGKNPQSGIVIPLPRTDSSDQTEP